MREKRKIQLRKDLLKQGKRIARAQDRKLYQVIESALEEYIQRHGVPE
jgi:predicted transcriptional regulator